MTVTMTSGDSRVDGPAEVAAQLAAARDEQGRWAALDPRDRARHLLRVRESIADRAPEIARTLSEEMGKPLTDAWLETMAGCSLVSWSARHAPKMLRARQLPTAPLIIKRAEVVQEPFGVIAVITPWNYPVAISMQSIPVALVAGNTILYKPSELTPETGRLLASAINAAGRPLVHVVQGDGSTGDAVVRSGVDKVVFTGSGGVGRKILHAAADCLVPVVLELGGKDVAIVLDDADVDRAARTVVGAAFANAGQLCMATERAYVTPRVYEPFVQRVAELTRGLNVGPDPTANVGPLTRPSQVPLLEGRVRDAVARGATVVCGGGQMEGRAAGYFAPTVLTGVPPDAELMREESFGPILSIVRVASEDEAVRLANDHPLGLNGSVFSASRTRARRVAARLETGGVHLNDALVGNGIGAAPFGGVKQSGFGRLQGDVGLYEFVRTKTIVSDRFGRGPALAALTGSPKRPTPELVERVVSAAYSSRRIARRLGRRR